VAKVIVPLKNIANEVENVLKKYNIPYSEIKVSKNEKREDNVEFIISIKGGKRVPFEKTIEYREILYKELIPIFGDVFIVSYIP
jgi:galactitol-specific phosphotransferase system IIB component